MARPAQECHAEEGLTCTGVGMWPPNVGLPTTKPLQRFTTSTISSLLLCSQLTLSTPTPPRRRPRLQDTTGAVSSGREEWGGEGQATWCRRCCNLGIAMSQRRLPSQYSCIPLLPEDVQSLEAHLMACASADVFPYAEA